MISMFLDFLDCHAARIVEFCREPYLYINTAGIVLLLSGYSSNFSCQKKPCRCLIIPGGPSCSEGAVFLSTEAYATINAQILSTQQ